MLSSALAVLRNLFRMIDRFHPQGPAGAQMEKQRYLPNCLISLPSLDSPPSRGCTQKPLIKLKSQLAVPEEGLARIM